MNPRLLCFPCPSFFFLMVTFKSWWKIKWKANTSGSSNSAHLVCIKTLMCICTGAAGMQSQTANGLLGLAMFSWSQIRFFHSLAWECKVLLIPIQFFSASSVFVLPPLYLGIIKLQCHGQLQSHGQNHVFFRVRQMKPVLTKSSLFRNLAKIVCLHTFCERCSQFFLNHTWDSIMFSIVISLFRNCSSAVISFFKRSV